MGTCQIVDKILDAAGHVHNGSTVYAWPRENTLRLDDGTAVFRPIDPDPALKGPYQYGVSALSAGSGDYSFYLPQGTAEQHPEGSIWFIRLPDGKTIQGVPPDAVGPFTIDDLLTNEGWTLSEGGNSSAPFYKGEVALVAAPFWDIQFPTEFPNDKIHASISFQEDQAGGGVPGWYWLNRSQSAIRIGFTSPYTGIMTFKFEADS